MAGAELVRIASQAQRLQIVDDITRVTRSPGGIARVFIDPATLLFDPVNPAPASALGRYGEVLGPRYHRLEETTRSAVDGVIDLREGVTAPGDGVRWELQFLSAHTGEPLTDGLVGAWMTAPKGHNGMPVADYLPDAFRGHTRIGADGKVTILAHDPQPYMYNGNWLEPHIHGAIKGVPDHVDMPFQQMRTDAVPNDADDVAYRIIVPKGEGRLVLGPWDDHPGAVHATSGSDAGFIVPSEPAPLR